MKSIILAKVTNDGVKFTGKTVKRDGNYFEETVPCPKAKALVWLSNWAEYDLEKAKEYAKENNYLVYLIEYGDKMLDEAREKVLLDYEKGLIKLS